MGSVLCIRDSLKRSLLKDRRDRDTSDVERDFERLLSAYEAQWNKGY